MIPLPEDNSMPSWMEYLDTLPSLGEHWVDTSKSRGNPVVLADTLGANLKAKTALTGSLLLSKRIAKLSPEQNIGLLLPTTAGGLLSGMAVMILGKTLVPLNYTAPLDGMISAIEQADLKTVYTSSKFLEKCKARGIDLAPLADKVKLIMLEDVNASIPTWEKVLTLLSCKLFSATAIKRRYCAKPDLDSTAVILFSSGSEGDPKGVMLSHKNILANVKQVSKILNAHDGDIILANLPIFHSFGMTACLFLPLLERIRVICHPDPTDVVIIAKTVRQNKATLLFGTSSSLPPLYQKIPRSRQKILRLSGLQWRAQKNCSQKSALPFSSVSTRLFTKGYGCTELSPVATVNTPFPNLESDHLKDNNKPGSVGKPIPGTLLRIADPDSLEPLAAGHCRHDNGGRSPGHEGLSW